METALARITVGALAGRWAGHKATHAAVNELITVDYLLTMLNFKLLFRVPWKTEATILTAKLRASFCRPSGLRLHMGHSGAHFRLSVLTVGDEGGGHSGKPAVGQLCCLEANSGIQWNLRPGS